MQIKTHVVCHAAQEAGMLHCEYIDKKNNNIIFSFVLLQQNWTIFAVEIPSTISTPNSKIVSSVSKILTFKNWLGFFIVFLKKVTIIAKVLSDSLEIER